MADHLNDLQLDRQKALAAKLLKSDDMNSGYDSKGRKITTNANLYSFEQISNKTAEVVSDIESMSQVLPDIVLSEQILTSSIMSPKDMSTPQLSYTATTNKLDEGLKSELVAIIKNFFENEYKLFEKLSKEIPDALMYKGSSIRLIIPESSVDYIINGKTDITLESLKDTYTDNFISRPLGILGKANAGDVKKTTVGSEELTLESLFDAPQTEREPDKIISTIWVTDNPDILKVPKILKKVAADRTSRALKSHYSGTMESIKAEEIKVNSDKDKDDGVKDKVKHVLDINKKSDLEFIEELEAKRKNKQRELIEVRSKSNLSKKSVGHPMDISVPSEAVIPAYLPSDPSEHIGYYFLLDQYGYFLNTAAAIDHYNELKSNFNNSSNNPIQSVVHELRNVYSGSGNENRPVESMMEAVEIFSNITERNLLERLRNGVGNYSIELSTSNNIYQIMLARACKKMQTRVLYVPAAMVNYLAFNYSTNGVGKSLIENTRVLGGLRVLLMLTSAVGQVRNSVPRTSLEIDFDPRDADPVATGEMVKDLHIKSKSDSFPLAAGSPDASLDYINKASVDVVYRGHPELPEMKVESRDASTNRNLPDDRLREDLKDMHIESFGLSAETVDASKRVDFATSIIQSSLMLNRRIFIYQKIIEPKIAERIRMFTTNSEPLLKELVETVRTSKQSHDCEDDYQAVEEFIDNIAVELPKPDTLSLKAKMDAMEEFSRAAERMVDWYVSDDMASRDAEGDLADMMRELRSATLAHLCRNFSKQNGIFPELDNMFTKDEEGNSVFDFDDSHKEHMDAVLSSFNKYIMAAKEAANAREQKWKEQEERLDEQAKQLEEDRKRAVEEASNEMGFDENDMFMDGGSGSDDKGTDDPDTGDENVGGTDDLPDEGADEGVVDEASLPDEEVEETDDVGTDDGGGDEPAVEEEEDAGVVEVDELPEEEVEDTDDATEVPGDEAAEPEEDAGAVDVDELPDEEPEEASAEEEAGTGEGDDVSGAVDVDALPGEEDEDIQ